MVTGKAKKKSRRVPLKGAKSARASGKSAPRRGKTNGAARPKPAKRATPVARHSSHPTAHPAVAAHQVGLPPEPRAPGYRPGKE